MDAAGLAPSVQFGQVVVGAPGAGKSTYCRAAAEFLRGTGRKVAIVNLDPGNEAPGYEAAVDVRELCTVEGAMREHGLGPNGALVWCMETLEASGEWLERRLAQLRDHYLLLDCPGQIELFTHHPALRSLLARFGKRGSTLRLCAVTLAEAHHVADAGKYVAVALVALAAMLQLELPTVHVLSKVGIDVR
jgi:GTPase SAR1 family protein